MNGQEPDLVRRDFNRYDSDCAREAALDSAVEAEADEIRERFSNTLVGRTLKSAAYSRDEEHRAIAGYLQCQADEYAEELARRTVEKQREDDANAAADCAAYQQEQDRMSRYEY